MASITTTNKFALWWKKATEWFITQFFNLAKKIDYSANILKDNDDTIINKIDILNYKIDYLIEQINIIQKKLEE